MGRVRIFSWMMLGMILAGCVSVKTTAEFDAGTNFARLQTWDWKPDIKVSLGDPRINDALIDQEVRAEVSRYLTGAGYPKASLRPDFLVSYYASLEEKMETSPADTPDMEDARTSERPAGAIQLNKIKDKGLKYNPNPPRSYEYEYEIASLVVDILDPRTGKRLWQGKAEAEVNRHKSPEVKAKKILEATRKVIAQFPPPSAN